MRKNQYFTEQEKQNLTTEAMANGEILIAESNTNEGNFLTFCTIEEIPQPINPEPAELELLKSELDSTKEAVNFLLMNLI